MSLKKVCLYISAFPPGGAERQIVNLARELAGRGINVVLLHGQKDIRQAYYLNILENSGVELIYAPTAAFLQEGIHLARKYAQFYAHIPAPGVLKMGILYLAGAIQHIGPDVVHSYLDVPNCMAACAAFLADVPHLMSFRNVDPQTGEFVLAGGVLPALSVRNKDQKTVAPRLAELTLPIYRYLLGASSPHFEANSKTGLEHYARWLNIDPGRITYNPNGIDPTVYVMQPTISPFETRKALGIPAAASVILTLARFAPSKAPEIMLDIFSRVHAGGADVRYIIAGMRMTENDEMGVMVMERGLCGSVHLLGACDDVTPLLSSADIFLMPSRVEGFPNAIMEAMAAGLPIVASNVGGIPDLVRHGQDGLLHGPEDVDGMVESVLALLDDAALRARLGAAGRQRITEEFTMQKLGDRVLQRYEELLACVPR